MPYNHKNLKIPETEDRRVKLTSQDKENIRNEYFNNDNISQRDLAKKYNVSRRTIVFTLYPERRVENYKKRVKNHGHYYNREKHTEAMRKHRAYKQQLKQQNKLIEKI